MMSDLVERRCTPCERGGDPLGPDQARELLAQVPGWKLNEDCTEIQRVFSFRNYYETMAFVNAVAWLAHRENHHPDLEVSYTHCRVRYRTHAVRGLSANDFICAAKVNALAG